MLYIICIHVYNMICIYYEYSAVHLVQPVQAQP